MKRFVLFIILSACLFMMSSANAQMYWNGGVDKSWTGTGTADDPILISTAEQLAGFADSVNRGDDFSGRYIELAADIYLSDSTLGDSLKHEWEHPIGQFQSGGQGWEYTLDTAWFRGNFDGKNHTIYNLFHGTTPETPDWNNPDNPFGDLDGIDFSGWDKALFGFVENATIKNVRLENAVVTGASKIATLAAEVRGNSLIENCHATGYVNAVADVGGYAGGLITYLTSGQVINCSANVTTLAMRYVGGLIGLVSSDGVVRDCSASGAAHCVEYDAGGLVGTNSGLIENSHASGRVSRAYYQHAYYDCGGFVGDNSGIIRNCSAKGDVHMYGQNGGGFVGWNKGRIESSYCLGDVHDETDGYGGSASAFCGMNGRDAVGTVYPTDVPGTLINCFATGKTDIRDESNLTGYPAGRPSNGFLNSYGTNAAKIVNCSYRQVRPDTLMGIRGGVQELQESYMKSQAFVDELNMYAALYGISTWEYRAGDYPVPTGVNATNITDYLAGGSGTEEDPFLIETKQHLENFREMVNHGEHFEGKYIRQTADIALNAPRAQWGIQMPEQWTAIGTMKFVTCYEPHYMVERSHTYHFRGTYDGGFHKVENMYIDDPAGRPAGLFGILYHNAVIKNLSVTDAYVISPATHAGVAILASDVDRYANNVYISQCHTSGTVGDPDNVYWLIAASAIVNGIALEGDNWILNCSSSADVYAAEQPSAVTHQGGIGGTDTIGNFLFTGTLTKRCNMSYCSLRVPNNQDSWIVSQNGYFDSDKFKPYNDVNNYNHLGRSTAYLQSAEFANVLNDYVDNWNATHAYQLDYWQPQEGDYPMVSPYYKPSMVVTFESNGGSAVAAKRVSENSHLLMPDKPTKEGHIFAGWYEDAGFTKVFAFDSTAITQSMTLYAKWLEPTYDEYDYSIFSNKFATEFHITNKAQLLGFVHAVNGIDGVLTPNNFKGKTVYLDCDILLNDTTDWEYWGKYTYAESWTPIGTGSYYIDPIHPFLGTFDGQGHVISGLYIDGNEDTIRELEEHGLFGYVGTKGETTVIRNLGIQASVADMRGNLIGSNMGLLAGVLRDGTITQCFTQGRIVVDANSNEDIGGLVGQLGGINYDAGGVVTDCYSQVDLVFIPMDINVTVRGLFGSGLVDWNNGSISNSYVAGGSWQEGVAGGTISNVYYNKELSPKAGAKTGTALTTNEMHAKSSFAGFDFDSIWGRNDTINGGYPYLRCFYEENIPDSPDPVKVTGIDFTEAGMTFDIIAGEQLQLHAKVLPEDALDQQIIWTKEYKDSYGYKDILSVDSNGLVTTYYDRDAMLVNHFVVTAATYEGNYQKKCTVNVHRPQIQLGYIKQCRRIGTTEWTEPVSSWKVVGWEYQMAFYLTPDSLHQPLTITNSNPEVATVSIISQDTIVPSFIYGSDTPVRCVLFTLSVHKEGELILDAIHPKGYTYSYPSAVPIKYFDVTGINIEASTTSIKIGETLLLKALTDPVESSVQPDAYMWSSSDENILKVDANGLVTGIGEGTATVTLTSTNPALSATKEITVEHIQPTRMEIISSDEDSEIFEGDTCTLTVKFTPANTTMRDVEWGLRTAGDTTYVKLIPMGDSCKVIGLKEAWRIYIQAKSLGSSGRYGEYGLRINKKVLNTSLSFHNTSVSMVKGETKNIRLNKTTSSNESIIFKSSNEDIITIDEESQYISTSYIRFDIKALAAGTATITATAKESGLTATCEVTVTSNDFFTITFLNENGIVLQSSQVREGEIPVYTGETPTKAASEEYTYTFVGWTPELVPVTTDATYTATYSAHMIPEFTVNFMDWDGTSLKTEKVRQGKSAIAPADPIREGYTFIGWDKDFSNVQSDLTVTAQYEKIIIYYTITFVNDDGTVLQASQVAEGEMPVYTGETPTKQETAEFRYFFESWTPEIVPATADATYTATYTEFKRKYQVCFLNYNGIELQSSEVEYGVLPEYMGETPTRPSTAQYNYVFDGWSPEIVAVTKDANYTATFTNILRQYTVTFLDWDGTQLSQQVVDYGTAAIAPANPVREGYTFVGWDKDFSNVQSDLTVTAQYEKIIIYYIITFVNDDGTVLQASQVAEGEMPVYTGETPTKQETAEFRYFFECWTPEIVPATADATYTATYTAKTRHYYIQFVNYDGTVLQSSQVAYGTMPEYTGETPTKPSDQYDYIFAGWTPEVIAVIGFATYTATYTEQRIMPVLSNDEVYHIIQPYRNNTAWAVERGGTQMLSNMQIGAENKSDDPRQQFAFLTFDNGETYYLYHEAEQKYISKGGQLVDVAVDPVYFKRGAYESTFMVYFDADHYVNVNDYGNLVIDYWKTPDGGNSCVITAVPKYIVTYYTVTFLDWDGTELHVERVEQGCDAVGPATNPTREGYVFIGWSKPITNITCDLIVIALYDKASGMDDVAIEQNNVRKTIENGQLIIILPDGTRYSSLGKRLVIK